MNAARRMRRALGIGLAAAGLGVAATPALAATATAPAPAAPLSSCDSGALSQPFTAHKDQHWYTLAPGGDFEPASAGDWELTGGATITSVVQPDGTVGGVLDLPSKAQASSPVLCITSDFPTARLWVRNIVGSEGVYFHVSYLNSGTWTAPKNTGQFHGEKSAWSLSKSINLQPSSKPGWQQVRFTFLAGGSKSRFQVNDFWVDPKMRG
jgi:hypothetical protein